MSARELVEVEALASVSGYGHRTYRVCVPVPSNAFDDATRAAVLRGAVVGAVTSEALSDVPELERGRVSVSVSDIRRAV